MRSIFFVGVSFVTVYKMAESVAQQMRNCVCKNANGHHWYAATTGRQPVEKISYGVSIIRWITSCHKNRMTTCVIILWRERVTPLTTSVSAMRFLLQILSILKAIKSNFRGSYDTQNLILVVISYEIYDTPRWLVS